MATGALARTTLHNVAAISAFIMTFSFQITEIIELPAMLDYLANPMPDLANRQYRRARPLRPNVAS
ncbi:MAG: hypothetical protein AB7U61_12455, partial [Methylocystis sp.]